MSRIGKREIKIPNGVEINISQGIVHVKGPKGVRQIKLNPDVRVKKENDILLVVLKDEAQTNTPLWGLTQVQVASMVEGVTQGFQRELELKGVGFRAALKGQDLEFQLGFSHPVRYVLPKGVSAKIERETRITLSGIDKQCVGETAAQIRSLRPPDVYKGKGIRYKGEFVRKKAGKSGVTEKEGMK